MSSTEWEAVIGLEVHAHLKTKTKMFCRCALEYGARREHAYLPGVSRASRRAARSERARDRVHDQARPRARLRDLRATRSSRARTTSIPTCRRATRSASTRPRSAGRASFVIPTADGEEAVGIVRAHLEEDAAKTVHAGGATGRSVGADYSLVDFNRGGTPLIEIVSEPDLRSADEADRYLRLLRQTIVELGVSDAEMEKGTLRADVNVSVRKRGEEGYRPRWELKNMNSFTFIRRGIEAAVREQVAAYERGEEIEQSTYDYDPDTDRLTVHRSKEEADDYRYFPEPDLVPVEPPAELVERLRARDRRAAGRAHPPARRGSRLRRRRRARHDREGAEGRRARRAKASMAHRREHGDEPAPDVLTRERAGAREDPPGER